MARAQSWQIHLPSSSHSIRFGTTSATIVISSLVILAFFSVADFRESGYRQRERDLWSEQQKSQVELQSFAQWLADKENDLDRFLMMTGERPESLRTASAAPSYESVKSSLERIENRLRILSDFQMRDEDYFWNVPSIAPVALQEEFTLATGALTSQEIKKGLSGVSSMHGMRFHPIDKREEMHYGIDIFCPIGTSVRATANGIVEFVGRYSPNEDNLRHSYGNFVIVRHGDTGIQTTYAHLSDLSVVQGQVVKRGDTIAKTGNSGSSTGPHIHYEIARNGVKVNPLNYISDVPLIQGGKKIFYVKKLADSKTKRRRA